MKHRRGAKVLIRRTSDGKYLLLTSSLWPENPRRSQMPDLPGGVIETHETIKEGLLREVKEETGLSISETSLVPGKVIQYQGSDRDAASEFSIYLAEVEGNPDVTLSWEHESYRWIDGEELLGLSIRRPYNDIFNALHREGKLLTSGAVDANDSSPYQAGPASLY